MVIQIPPTTLRSHDVAAKTLVRALDCTFHAEPVLCGRDDRPVDGDLVEILVQQNAQKSAEHLGRDQAQGLLRSLHAPQQDDTVDIANRLERR